MFAILLFSSVVSSRSMYYRSAKTYTQRKLEKQVAQLAQRPRFRVG